MKIVLDTNVLVGGLLKPFGPSGEVLRMLTAARFDLCADARILAEYREVLHRPRFRIAPGAADLLLQYIEAAALPFPAAPLPRALPDPDDEPFLEVATEARADYLVTWNLKHYPADRRGHVPVATPRDFLESFRRGRPGRGG